MTKNSMYLLTRPNDKKAYAPGDVIGHEDPPREGNLATSNLNFPIGEAIGEIGLVTVVQSTAQQPLPKLELWLFSAPIKDQLDNSPLAVPGKELERHLVAIIPLSKAFPVAGGGSCVHQSDGQAIKIQAVHSLYGRLVVRNAYTPAAQEQFAISLRLN